MYVNAMERNMNKRKYFPSDDEEDLDLQDETRHSQNRLREDGEDSHEMGKDKDYRLPRAKEHGAGRNYPYKK